jgi:glucans biosynthesis protein
MSGSESHRVLAMMVLATTWIVGCGTEPGQDSTLPSSEPAANSVQPSALPQDPTAFASLRVFVDERARRLAATTYIPPDSVRSAAGERLDYEEYRDIRFRPEAALWRDRSPFQVQLFPAGYIYRTSVRINVVDDGSVTEVPFDPTRFTYGDRVGEAGFEEGEGPGYAGFRLLTPLEAGTDFDEVASFLGASYFRLVGPDQVYGLSGRGLAIGAGREGGEEFPDFREFWLVRPGPGDTSVVFHALLDSPSATGAYHFELSVGARVELSVDLRVFARRDIDALGVAPMSSMFLHGGYVDRGFDDVRPEVHDSDGLLAWTGAGEWIWRPLTNHAGLHVSSLRDADPQGFGLVQREREFDRYLDLEAGYHRRPSLWVRVETGDWGSGGVELLEIPTDSEFNDNVAAYWVPDRPVRAGEERRFEYTLMTFARRLPFQSLAQVERTRIGRDGLPGEVSARSPRGRRFLVDFTDASSVGDSTPPTPVLRTTSGAIVDPIVERLPSDEGWRVSFRLEPQPDQPADMRIHLERAGEPISETWSFVWYPAPSQRP